MGVELILNQALPSHAPLLSVEQACVGGVLCGERCLRGLGQGGWC